MASWRSLGLVEELCSAARKVGAEIPTQIQTIAIPKLLEGHHAAIAAATGTGKTLAYLLPMMQRIKQDEEARPEAKHQLQPRALVLAPTRDLVEQIHADAKALSHATKLRVRTMTEADRSSWARRRLEEEGSDLLMGTPESVLRAVSARKMSLRKVVSVTVDEADDVLLRGFYEPLVEVLRLCAPRSTFASLAEAKDDENKGAQEALVQGFTHMGQVFAEPVQIAREMRVTANCRATLDPSWGWNLS